MLVRIHLIAVLLLAGALFAALQPLVGKQFLPIFGGIPTVWNTTKLFFECALVLGGAYIVFFHWIRLIKWQAAIQGVLVMLSFALFPIGLSTLWLEKDISSPFENVLISLLLSIGLPTFVLISNSLVFQYWGTLTQALKDPYRLFGITALGGVLGLLAYSLAEPYVGLKVLSYAWSAGYVVFAVLFITFYFYMKPAFKAQVENTPSETAAAQPPTPDPLPSNISPSTYWALLPAATTAMLIGFTQTISIDLSPSPLLWCIPMALFGLTIFATFTFPEASIWKKEWFTLIQPFLIIPIVILIFFHEVVGNWTHFLLHASLFTVTALICHHYLVALRPASQRLPQFYMAIGAGCFLGALFMTVIAPKIFKSPIEYGLIIALICFLRTRDFSENLRNWTLYALPLGIILVALIYNRTLHEPSNLELMLLASFLSMALYAVRNHALAYALSVVCLVIAPDLKKAHEFSPGVKEELLFKARNFFGVSMVHKTGGYLYYTNGNTLHGMQNTAEGHQDEPLTYYHHDGPYGQFMKWYQEHKKHHTVLAVGLGTGTVAIYGREGERVDFIELDPLVKRIANTEFSYLKLSKAKINVVVGDGRTKATEMSDDAYDLVVLDAFSSDSVPTHLLTREALDIYFKKLKKDGVLLVHATSRYYHFKPLLVGLAQAMGLELLHGNDFEKNTHRTDDAIYVSDWYLLTKDKSLAKAVSHEATIWQPVPLEGESVVWTDDYANRLALLHDH